MTTKDTRSAMNMFNDSDHLGFVPSRRDTLKLLSCGFGMLALRGLCAADAQDLVTDPLAPK